jgi:FkbM family methyltransferase
MDLAKIKRNIRAWLSGRPWLLQLVFRVVGKPYTEIAIFRSLVRPGDTVLDLGANTGQYTCLFCSLVGPSGTVHAFEPVPQTFAMLKENTARYAKKYRLFLNDLAVGDSEGVIKMFVSNGRFTEASMVAHSSQSVTNYDCPVTTIDRYVNKNNIKDVAVIKCDVEGAELLAMKGARALLKSSNPPILFLEAWSDWTKDFGYQPSDLFEFLEREAGYAIYHVYRGEARRISAQEKLPPDSFPDFLNFLCIVPSAHGDRFRAIENAGIKIVDNNKR